MHKIKPYQIVFARPFGSPSFAEAISFPFTNEAGQEMVNVRQPNEPTSMLTLHLRDVEPAPRWGSRLYTHFAIVSSAWSLPSHSFPVDMLRYETAFPISFKLVEDNLGRDIAIPHIEGDRLVVAYTSINGTPQWATRRWESFGWVLTTAGLSTVRTTYVRNQT